MDNMKSTESTEHARPFISLPCFKAANCVVIFVICMVFIKQPADMDLLWQMVITLVILATSGYIECQSIGALDPNCFNTTTCPCCSVPCPSDGSGRCNDNCKDGYYGDKCLSRCPFNCIRCEYAQQGIGVSNCTLCKYGFYSTASQYQCQSKCASNCKTCESNASHCTSCHDGFYVTDSHQCAACNANCSTCNSSSNCMSCQFGFYLDAADATCHKCNPICSHCNSSQNCLCSNGCYRAAFCSTKTGVCIFGCKSKFNSTVSHLCDKCINGYYGVECDLQCHHNCHPTDCHRIDGRCYECYDGFFGAFCNMSCPENCRSGCDKITGQCNSCKVGFYDKYCMQECGTNCLRCTMTNGSCSMCVDGFFSYNCTKNCSKYCMNGRCNITNGHCDCVTAYTGLTCEDRINTTSTKGPPLVVPATQQNYVGASVGITLAVVAVIAGLVGVGVRWYRRRKRAAGRGISTVLGLTVNMSDIEKLEGQLSRIDKELNKWTSRKAEVASKLEGMKANIPYRNAGISTVFGLTVNMSDIEKLEGQLFKIDKEVNKWTSRKAEVASKLEGMKANIPYRNTDRADNIEGMSYEMLQKGNNESPYSSIQ